MDHQFIPSFWCSLISRFMDGFARLRASYPPDSDVKILWVGFGVPRGNRGRRKFFRKMNQFFYWKLGGQEWPSWLFFTPIVVNFKFGRTALTQAD
jgi:hypothetical protein